MAQLAAHPTCNRAVAGSSPAVGSIPGGQSPDAFRSALGSGPYSSDGAPHQGQCEGCTTTAWHLKDAVYLNARGVSFAILSSGRWDEVASYA